MRQQAMIAVPLSLLLCACGGDAANQADNFGMTGANDVAVAPANGAASNAAASPGEPAAPQQPGNGAQAPEPSGQVALLAAPARTTGGSTMTLTLTNGSSGQIGYNLCTSALQTSAGVDVPTSRVCTMELRTLEPGRSADYRYELPVNMADGSYRFLTQVEWMQSGRRSGVASNSFTVR